MHINDAENPIICFPFQASQVLSKLCISIKIVKTEINIRGFSTTVWMEKLFMGTNDRHDLTLHGISSQESDQQSFSSSYVCELVADIDRVYGCPTSLNQKCLSHYNGKKTSPQASPT